MLPRVLEPEVMDTPEEARDYDAMDHSVVNRAFVSDLLAGWDGVGLLLDVGTGTAQIPIELCRRDPSARVVGIDLSEPMLEVGRHNVSHAGFGGRIRLARQDASRLAFAEGSFAAVISNSIVHHLPAPEAALREMTRVLQPGGVLFVRDLLRPADDASVLSLLAAYAGSANKRQQAMFEASLRAALTLAEIRTLVANQGFEAESVRQTTDRHWTWQARKPVH
jgi:ubiquinone/menaquinone biosynthesis C-methylase UbiE